MNTIEQALNAVARPDGFVSLFTVDVATGQVLASLRRDDDLDATGPIVLAVPHLVAAVTDAVHRLAEGAALDAADDDVEEMMLSTSAHHHVVRIVPSLGGGAAFLVLTVDRVHGNLAMARHALANYEAGLGA